MSIWDGIENEPDDGPDDIGAAMVVAISLGQGWPEGVPDTPANRALYDELCVEVRDLEAKGIEVQP